MWYFPQEGCAQGSRHPPLSQQTARREEAGGDGGAFALDQCQRLHHPSLVVFSVSLPSVLKLLSLMPHLGGNQYGKPQ